MLMVFRQPEMKSAHVRDHGQALSPAAAARGTLQASGLPAATDLTTHDSGFAMADRALVLSVTFARLSEFAID